MSNSYKEYASKEYVKSVVVSQENIEQIVANSLTEAKAYTDEKVENGVKSWNDLADKPFGEKTIESIHVAAEDLAVSFTPSGQRNIFYKVSDEVFTVSQLAGTILTTGNATTTLSEENLVEIVGGCKYSNRLVSIYDTTVGKLFAEGETEVWPSTGTYVGMTSAADTDIVFQSPVSIVNTLDEKFLPDTIASVSDVATAKQEAIDTVKAYTDEQINAIPATSWNDLTDKPFYDNSVEYVEWDGSTDDRYTMDLDGMHICHISDAVISDPNELIGARVIILNEAGDTVIDDVCQSSGSLAVRTLDDTGLIGIGANLFMCIPEDNYQSGFFGSYILEKKGIYAVLNMFEAMGAAETKIIAGELKTLDEKFIPNTIASVSDVAVAKQEAIEAASILTSPNGTKYRLTVSDDGTLLATPITTE